MDHINITLQAPVCTIDKFSETTGIPVSTIRLKIRQGEIPVMPKQGVKSKVLINMVDYASRCRDAAKCAEEAHKSPAQGAHHG